MNDKEWFILHYMHRDDANWKTRDTVLLSNKKGLTESEAEKVIRESLLDEDDHFFPLEVGLPILDGPGQKDGEVKETARGTPTKAQCKRDPLDPPPGVRCAVRPA